MSDTPRTDAAQHCVNYIGDEGECDYYAVTADFARQLELELGKLVIALRPFAALSQDHQNTLHPDVPIFAINGAEITKRDVDRAKESLRGYLFVIDEVSEINECAWASLNPVSAETQVTEDKGKSA